MSIGYLKYALQNGNEGALEKILASRYGPQVTAEPSAPAAWPASSWASSRGLAGLEERVTKGTTTPQDIAFLSGQNSVGIGSSLPPSAGAQAMWNDFVARVQDRDAGSGGIFGIKELSTGVPMLDNAASMLLTNSTGGQTGYNAATGGDLKEGVATDLAGLAAGAGLSQALPSIGLSTVAPSAAVGGTALGATGAAAGAGGETLASIIAPAAAEGAPSLFPLNLAAPEIAIPQLGAADLGAISTAAGSAPIIPSVTSALTTAAAAKSLMPAATPEADRTQGGQLTQTGTGQYENLGGDLTAPTGLPLPNANTGTRGIGGTTLADLLSGKVGLGDLASNATLGDLGRILGTVGATAGSVYADTERAKALKELSEKYMSFGAPSRARYEDSFAPGFDVNSIPGFTGALDSASNSMLRGLSTHGNPYGSPAALADTLKYVTGNVALPAIQNYRNQLAATGGFGAFSTAAPGAATGAIDATGSAYSDLGRGVGDILSPPTNLAALLRQLQGTGGSGARGVSLI